MNRMSAHGCIPCYNCNKGHCPLCSECSSAKREPYSPIAWTHEDYAIKYKKLEEENERLKEALGWIADPPDGMSVNDLRKTALETLNKYK